MEISAQEGSVHTVQGWEEFVALFHTISLWPFVRAFTAALFVGLVLTPLVRIVALRTGTVDHPNERRINKVDMPTAGGVAIAAAFWVGMSASGFSEPALGAFFLASLVIVFTGVLDDLLELRPRTKFFGQVAAAVILVAGGVKIEFITNPFGGMWYIGPLGIPLTILWIVGLINMINFIDGLDGLAAGVSVIACVPLFVVALQRGHIYAALMTIALMGASLGFLKYNFNPAKIIMGDTGAMFLGLVLATASVEGAMKGAAAVAMAIPAIALGLPIIDTVFAVARRVRAGKPFYAADRGHLHHRLLDLGLSQRQAVVILYGMALGLAGTALLVAAAGKTSVTVIALCVVVIVGLSIAHKISLMANLLRPKGPSNQVPM